MSKWITILVTGYLAIGSGSLTAQTEITSPLPEIVRTQDADLQMVGNTRLKRFGLHIYDASYWVQEKDTIGSPGGPIRALSIKYARNINQEKLLSSTKKEWQRLAITKRFPTDLWLSKLKELWPNVKKGDQLVVVSHPDGTSSFFSHHALLGEINDPDFGPSFLAIWVDERARFSKNRKELLGD